MMNKAQRKPSPANHGELYLKSWTKRHNHTSRRAGQSVESPSNESSVTLIQRASPLETSPTAQSNHVSRHFRNSIFQGIMHISTSTSASTSTCTYKHQTARIAPCLETGLPPSFPSALVCTRVYTEQKIEKKTAPVINIMHTQCRSNPFQPNVRGVYIT